MSFKRWDPEGSLFCAYPSSLVRVALSSESFPVSLALSSVHLKLWLLLHSRNHISTLQTSSGCTGAEVPVGVDQAAPPQPSSPRRGAEARK